LSDESEEDFATVLQTELKLLILSEGRNCRRAFFAEAVMALVVMIIHPKTYWAKIQHVLNRYDVCWFPMKWCAGSGGLAKCSGLKPWY